MLKLLSEGQNTFIGDESFVGVICVGAIYACGVICGGICACGVICDAICACGVIYDEIDDRLFVLHFHLLFEVYCLLLLVDLHLHLQRLLLH